MHAVQPLPRYGAQVQCLSRRKIILFFLPKFFMSFGHPCHLHPGFVVKGPFVSEFLELTEDEWMDRMTEGCQRIGRNLNDTRGLLHSFRDCREQMVGLFHDLREMMGEGCLDWEIAFEFRLKRARYVRIYADVLVITENRVFSLEFKMKDKVDPDEVSQAAKYLPYLEIVFGTDYEVIPALVLTAANELFEFASIGKSDFILPVCSGDMLFNVFDEYLGFLSDGEEQRN